MNDEKVLPCDPERVCPKCRSEDIATRWHPATLLDDGSPDKVCRQLDTVFTYCPGPPDREHLYRRCNNCGFAWVEETAEHDGAENARRAHRVLRIVLEELLGFDPLKEAA